MKAILSCVRGCPAFVSGEDESPAAHVPCARVLRPIGHGRGGSRVWQNCQETRLARLLGAGIGPSPSLDQLHT
jgi:hypothetical protein